MSKAPVSIGECCRCKEPMWMTQSAYETYSRNHQTFYCVHGHSQAFVEGETEADILRRERDRLKQQLAQKDDAIKDWQATAYDQRARREAAERSASAYKGQTTRLRNRVKAGVCPCCNRTFQQLARHMATQHPDFQPEAAQPEE